MGGSVSFTFPPSIGHARVIRRFGMFAKSYCEYNNIGYCDRKLQEIVGIVFTRTVLKLNRICCME